MVARHTYEQAKALLPLLRAISNEVRERRLAKARLEALREALESASRRSPEGFIRALQDLDTSIAAEDRGIESALREISGLGLKVEHSQPLLVYIPGISGGNKVIFYWEENHASLGDEEQESSVPSPGPNPEISK